MPVGDNEEPYLNVTFLREADDLSVKPAKKAKSKRQAKARVFRKEETGYHEGDALATRS